MDRDFLQLPEKYTAACHLHYLLIDKEVDYNEPSKSKKTAETAENGKEAKQPLFSRGEQGIRPGQRIPQRLLADRGILWPAD